MYMTYIYIIKISVFKKFRPHEIFTLHSVVFCLYCTVLFCSVFSIQVFCDMRFTAAALCQVLKSLSLPRVDSASSVGIRPHFLVGSSSQRCLHTACILLVYSLHTPYILLVYFLHTACTPPHTRSILHTHFSHTP